MHSAIRPTRSLGKSGYKARIGFSRFLSQVSTMAKLSINSTCRLPSGYDIPILGYGVYQTPAAVAADVVEHALKVGHKHVDSAVSYRNEEPSAEGMKRAGIPREELFFTTKIPPGQNDYALVKKHVDATLKKTGLDYVDLYLLHAPYGGEKGRLSAWKALVESVAEGKIRSIGVSNYGVHHLNELETYIKQVEEKEGKGKGGIISVNQVELHPFLQRADIVQWCEKRGVILEAYSPLIRATRFNDPLVTPLVKKYNKSASQILLRWSLQKGFVALPKSVNFSRIEENVNIFDFELSEEDMNSLHTTDYSPCTWDPTTSRD